MKKILLIDDVREPQWIPDPDGDNSNFMVRPKYKAEDVEIARTAEEGIEKLKEQKWDLILLDHDMGLGKNGMDVLKFLMNPDGNQHIPKKIYLVTANVVAGPNMMSLLEAFKKEGLLEDFTWIR